ncbi:MAG: rRNA pseudouridine synthase [Spirochaetaceae bacterium]|jgi:23S rRNA pseudouridine2605 synthase|nr:rRNA pseudouridine synthase [Spirochaetaceae bacterium]
MCKPNEDNIRLHVYLAHAGVASRRECEKIIAAGRVSVNGTIITTLGSKVCVEDFVCVDGKAVTPEKHFHYIVMNKPPFYLCSQRDPLNRPLARDLLPSKITERLYSAGRLDFRSSGLIIWTNDGEFAVSLTHPSCGIEKEYIVETSQIIPEELLHAFFEGITIENIFYRCIKIEKITGKSVRITLVEGKNREIRRVFSYFHLHPTVLRRIRIGCVLLDGLTEGKTRSLSPEQINSLMKRGNY